MTTVIKVGGSLFDVPDLAKRLRRYLSHLNGRVRIYPGGGPAADVVRVYDARHALGEEACHWLALRMLTVNAHVLAWLLPDIPIATANGASKHALLDPYALAEADETNPGRFPHSWKVTSDSLAVRAAMLEGANELILLKSVPLPEGVDWNEAVRRKLVDPFFPMALEQTGRLKVQWINFRTWTLGT
ncbi:MAG: uridylate kinase [Planctomycetes bacterium]|nr:uridylate kinase [Planctomycetota bacterium]